MDSNLIVQALCYCMACDGEIAPEEQKELYHMCQMETDLVDRDIKKREFDVRKRAYINGWYML